MPKRLVTLRESLEQVLSKQISSGGGGGGGDSRSSSSSISSSNIYSLESVRIEMEHIQTMI